MKQEARAIARGCPQLAAAIEATTKPTLLTAAGEVDSWFPRAKTPTNPMQTLAHADFGRMNRDAESNTRQPPPPAAQADPPTPPHAQHPPADSPPPPPRPARPPHARRRPLCAETQRQQVVERLPRPGH